MTLGGYNGGSLLVLLLLTSPAGAQSIYSPSPPASVPQGQAALGAALRQSLLGMAAGAGIIYLILRGGKLVFGRQKINVRPKGADKVEWFTADHETPGSEDLCFLTASSPDEVVAHLKANGVAIEEGPVDKQGARGTIRSVYCRDPDGSLIEISSYENG